MESESPLIIVSVFGRGNWLASEAVELGIPTTLIDVSEQMGNWAPEDWEGPFGQFFPDAYSKNQRERLLYDDEFIESPMGFTLWLKDGPLELKSQVVSHRLQTLKQNEDVLGYVNGVGVLKTKNYGESLIARLAHYYGSARFFSLQKALSYGYPSPLFSKFGIKMPTRRGLESGFEWLKKKGVHVIKNANINDISFSDKNSISGIEVHTDRTWLYKCNHVLWLLSSEESSMMSSRVVESLFPRGVLEPTWCWMRYRVKMENSEAIKQFPLHFVVINDFELPLTHENYMVFCRTPAADQFDVWMVLPNVQRFNKSYLAEKAEAVKEVMLTRVPNLELNILEYPQEYKYTYNQVGPSRHPIFLNEKSMTFFRREIKNLVFSGPEHWVHLSQEGQFNHQQSLLNSLKIWWRKREEARIRSEEKLSRSKND